MRTNRGVLHVRNYLCHYRQNSGGTFTGRSTFGLHRGEHCLDARLDGAVHPLLLLGARVVETVRDHGGQAGVPSHQCGAADRSEMIRIYINKMSKKLIQMFTCAFCV